MSCWTGAIDHNFGVLPRKQPRGEFLNSIERQVYGPRQMRMLVSGTWERFNEDKVFPAIKPVFEFLT